LGEAFVSAIPNDYALVREAIDRGVPLDEVKPGNKITAQLKKLVVDPARAAEGRPVPLLKKLKLQIAG
jgi:pilus assembly protein CpaE